MKSLWIYSTIRISGSELDRRKTGILLAFEADILIISLAQYLPIPPGDDRWNNRRDQNQLEE